MPGCAHHVIQRGNNRASCFHDGPDYRRYLEYLRISSKAYAVAIHSYVLMTNHVHLLLTPEDSAGCGKMMQSVGRRYVRYFNDRNSRTGTLWEGRYKSTLVDSDNYFFTVSRYIELNPVRARMVSGPADYPWSSFHQNALGLPANLLSAHALYKRLGNTQRKRQAAYLKLFSLPIPTETLEKLREATNKAWAFGDEAFQKSISKRANRQVASSGWGGNRRS